MTQSFRNHLLAALSPADYGLLEVHLTPIEYEIGQSFEVANKPIEYVHFPEDGIVSIVAKSNHEQTEAGIVGQEGMTGIPVILGNDRWVNDTYVQVAGNGRRIMVDNLRRAMSESASLRTMFLAFTQAFIAQTTQTSLTNAKGMVGMRLARWLVMAHDRLDGNELPIPHEFLELMLNIGRAGVNAALQTLQDDGLVVAHRGVISVTDRAGLIRLADRFYGVAESEYRRLIPGSQFGMNKLGAPQIVSRVAAY